MLKHRYIDGICIILAAAACVMAAVFLMGEKLGIESLSSAPEYSARLFDDSYVHHIDLRVKHWDILKKRRKRSTSNVTQRLTGNFLLPSACARRETTHARWLKNTGLTGTV